MGSSKNCITSPKLFFSIWASDVQQERDVRGPLGAHVYRNLSKDSFSLLRGHRIFWCDGKIFFNGMTNPIPEDGNKKFSSFIERVISFYCLFVRYKIMSECCFLFHFLMTRDEDERDIRKGEEQEDISNPKDCDDCEELHQISVTLRKCNEMGRTWCDRGWMVKHRRPR